MEPVFQRRSGGASIYQYGATAYAVERDDNGANVFQLDKGKWLHVAGHWGNSRVSLKQVLTDYLKETETV